MTVFYDRDDPGRVTIDGEANLGGLAWLAVLHLGTIAFALLLTAANLALRLERWRRLLTRGRWRAYDAVSTPRLTSQGHNALVLLQATDEASSRTRVLSVGWTSGRRSLEFLAEPM